MADMMTFPNTVEEFMEQYKIVDNEKIYTNGAELVPIFRMMQWFEHVSATDMINRQAVIDALSIYGNVWMEYMDRMTKEQIVEKARVSKQALIELVEQLPPIHPDNQVHLCDSCSYTYPECPSVYTDVIFGNGTGNDNICACSKYLPSAQPEIIYCGDCKYKDDGIDEDGIPFLKCLHGRSYGGTRINDFCSWAERREK